MTRKRSSDNKVFKITIYKLDNSFNVGIALLEYKKIVKKTYHDWNYEIFIRLKPNIPPAWKPLVENVLTDKDIPNNSYASLVIIFEKNENKFALTSGYGYADIREYGIKDYGIDISKKSLNPYELNHLYQKQPTGNVYGISRSLRGRYMPSIDSVNQRSVLKAIKGKVGIKGLGKSMEGRTSLTVTGKKNLDEVMDFLDEILEIERTEKIAVEINGLEEVEKKLSIKLDQEVLAMITSGQFADVLIGYDDDLVFRNCEILKIGNDKEEYLLDDIEEIFNAAKKQNEKNPECVIVTGYDENDQVIFRKKLFDLIEGELNYNDDKYFRIEKKWYKTNIDYKNRIEQDFKNIERMDPSYFKVWQKEANCYVNEDRFLSANINDDRVLSHKRKISQIEIADIIDNKNKYFIHVKKGYGAFLRNLFSQGYVAASMYNGNTEFKNMAIKTFSLDGNEKYTIVFAIFPEDKTNFDSIFTLFAKVDFLERYESLVNMGFSVKYLLIDHS